MNRRKRNGTNRRTKITKNKNTFRRTNRRTQKDEKPTKP